MASLPLSTTYTVSSSATNTFSILQPSPFFIRTSKKVSSVRKRNGHRFLVSCKATEDDENSHINISKNDSDSSSNKIDRRNMIAALGGLYGATTLFGGHPFALAAPVAPDVSECGPANLPPGVTPINCCPPLTDPIIDFQPPTFTEIRTRPAAHSADSAYIEKFNRAVQLMRQLPDSDPRSFMQQANVHCAYCNDAYDQLGFPDIEVQIHFSWLFFPFHRCYLYFFERILGKLIDDPNFALPFWNWDHPDGMQMPRMYTDPSSALYDPLRDRMHQPPAVVDLNYSGTDANISNDQLISQNLTIMYRQIVALGTTPPTFLGNPYRAGGEPGGVGSLENVPHGPVHVWTGDRRQPNFEDMGDFYSAARDPIFFAHHANIDRLWNVWKTLGGRRQDFTDPDFLNSSFYFYDENAQLVRIRVRDCLDSRNLGYVYQNVDNPWLNSRPRPRASGVVSGNLPSPGEVFPRKLDHVIKVTVKRPSNKKRSKKEKSEKDEILVVQGIEWDIDILVKFDVMINDDGIDAATMAFPDSCEFAGTFVNVPHHNDQDMIWEKKRTANLRLPITELLEDLDAENDEYVSLSLVPRNGTVIIRGVKIVLEDDCDY